MSARILLAFALACSLAYADDAKSAEWQQRTERAKALDVGESAPDWLVDSETYAFGVGATDWDALAQTKVAFITHCPVNRDYFERCHAMGIRCFPYVTFYQGFANQTYEGINLKDHAEFIEVNGTGDLTRTGFWTSEDAKNMYTTCPNVAAYQDAMVAWVRKVMELGADGVFVDNLGNRNPCFGPKFGKHQHLYDDQNHAFAMLLKRVRDVVKEIKPDGAVLGNSADPPSLPKEYWKYLDAEMLESYICTWVSTDRWFDWNTRWNKAGKDLQPYVQAGKQIQALSYIGHTHYGLREDGFFCYATARLAGFVWNGGTPISQPETADLYRVRLGKALSDELEANGVHYRVFERGFVAVNPDKEKPASIPIAAPMPSARVIDLFGDSVAAGWNRIGNRGYAVDTNSKHSGSRSIVCENPDPKDIGGAVQAITLHQTAATPLVVSGWSKAENVSGAADGNYALRMDVTYADGDHLLGQVAPFTVGSHDWENQTITISPTKPIESLSLDALFRFKSGKVWFDDITLREDKGAERTNDGGFEDTNTRGHLVDASTTKQIEIPAYSGRVYLFTPESADQLSVAGPTLTVITQPALGEVRFRVDGFDYWTYSGRWTTEYVLGPMFGKFNIMFDKPGKHTIEIVDTVPADMKTPSGYGGGTRLGEFVSVR